VEIVENQIMQAHQPATFAHGELAHASESQRDASSSELFRRLRTDILRCQLKPGTRLLFRTLREDYKAGVSQLREALMRLASEDLVVLENNKGFRVAPVSPEELLDITNVRCELEALAVRMAMEKGDIRWESAIVARHHELSRLSPLSPGGSFSDEWNAANEALHLALRAACGSPLLLGFCEVLSERYYRYRRLWAPHSSGERHPALEHERIVNSVIARDELTAIPLIKQHLASTTQELLANWSKVQVE
jgi:GntR family carbon starvation induced transcriptional regulator